MADKLDQATATMIKNLETKTGKSLAAWVEVVRGAGIAKHGEVVKLLKEKHELGHGYANLVAHEALSGLVTQTQTDAGDLVEAQYAGDKAALRPLYEQLIAAVQGLGPDVEVAPKKTYVSLRRSKQFALIQPSTKSRLDLGINLAGVTAQGRLEASGSFNAMVTHRVRLAAGDRVDAELLGWLRDAYGAA